MTSDLLSGHGSDLAPMVLLAAARSDQQAREIIAADGERVGAFSQALADTLLEDPRPATWGAVHRRLRARLTRVVPTQHPQLHGRGDLAVFDADPSSEPWSLDVAGVLADGRVRIAGGRLHGLAPGARIEIHRGVGEPTPDTHLVSGTISEASASSAWLMPDDSVDGATLAAGRVFLVAAAPSGLRLVLDGPDAWRAEWRRRARGAGFAVVADGGDLSLTLSDGIERLATGSTGAVLHEVAAEEYERTVVTLRRLAATHRILTLPLRAGSLEVGVRLLSAESDGTCAVLGLAGGSGPERVLQVGETVRLEITHLGRLPAWISVVHVDSLGLGRQLFPELGEPTEALAPGVRWQPPPCWTVRRPLGTEQLRVLATRNPVQLQSLLDGRMLRSAPLDGFAQDLQYTVVERAPEGDE